MTLTILRYLVTAAEELVRLLSQIAGLFEKQH